MMEQWINKKIIKGEYQNDEWEMILERRDEILLYCVMRLGNLNLKHLTAEEII